MITTDEVKTALERAFPTRHSLSRDDVVELRSKLCALDESDLIELIGPVLVGTLQQNASNSAGPDWVDSVVRFLAGPNLPPVAPDASMRLKRAADELNAHAEKLRAEQATVFKNFTTQQNHAILAWLTLIKSWSESNIDQSELDAAIFYWSARARV